MIHQELIERLAGLSAAQVELALVQTLVEQQAAGRLSVEEVLAWTPRIEVAYSQMSRLSENSRLLVRRLAGLPPAASRRIVLGF